VRVPSLAHLAALSDDVGVIQHATYDVPNRSTGYCTDDVARAFMVAVTALRRGVETTLADRLGRTYLSFLVDAQSPDGRFRNFMGYDRRWLEDVGSEDSNGRAIWALGFGARYAPRESWRRLCRETLQRALPAVAELTYPHALAYAAIGVAHARGATRLGDARVLPALADLRDQLRRRHAAAAEPGWDWFEPVLTYDCARLPEAMLRIGMVLEDPQSVELGLQTLAFYEAVTVRDGTFVPIGSDGWYPRGGERAIYAQQPLEAAAMVDAALLAHALTAQERYRALAAIAAEWFAGRNSLGLPLADGAACCDGLECYGVNENKGAESTLAYLAAAFAVLEPAHVVRMRPQSEAPRASAANTSG
jgi:hypothetical protein